MTPRCTKYTINWIASSLVVTGPFDVVTIVGSGSEMSRSQTQGSTPLAPPSFVPNLCK